MAELLDPRTIRQLAAEIGLRPTKQRGQNFVTDPNTVRRIVAKSGITADDVVLEVGPGLGSLTLGLLETGAQVTAIEIEDTLAALLPRTVAQLQPDNAERLCVVAADALTVTELPGPAPTAVVANLPYNVAVPVLLHLLATFDRWRLGLVMVQLEVADRLAAAPGSKVYGVPSAKVAWYAAAERVGTVPPTVFWPAPNVDSGLVRLTRREPPTTGASAKRSSPSSTRRSRSAARCCVRPCRGSSGHRLRRPRRSPPQASTRPRAAKCWRSATSRGSPSS